MWKKFHDFIIKDVNNENEVKMYAVIMRVLLIVMCVYGLISLITAAAFGHFDYVLVSLGIIAFTVLLFYLTYNNHTKLTVYLFQLGLILLILLNTIYYGYDSAVSQFVYVQIIMIFAIDYIKHFAYKIAATVALTSYRIILLWYFKYYEVPVYGMRYSFHWKTNHLVFCTIMIIFVVVISTADFTDMRKKFQDTNLRLRDVAGKDPLTGLYNRRSTQTFMEDYLEGFMRGEHTAITVVMADIDHFKCINDTYGHDNGDIVLTELANVMGAFMRDKGIASRWGGEEFVLVFVDHNGDDTYQLLTELQRKVDALRFNFNNECVKITLTYGVAEQGSEKDAEATIKEADNKLYIGKNKGRNIIIY